MSTIGLQNAAAEEPIIESDRSDTLREFTASSATLALWHRQARTAVQQWLASLPVARLPHGRVLVGREDIETALDDILDTSGTPRGPEASGFAEDVAEIAHLFAEVAGIETVDIGLEPLQHDSCWKFHRDYVRLRIVTTYLGPGTEFVDDENAERALEEQKAYRGRIHEIPSNTVALFRGAKFADGAGIVHRSPPIAGSGLTRLVLTLNAPSNVSPTLWTRDAGSVARQ